LGSLEVTVTANKISKYDIVEGIITGHAPYGLIIESASGVRGYIDSGDISDRSLEPEDWPEVGQAITGVLISHLRDGRLVVSARPSDVALVRSSSDVRVGMDAWARLCRADEEYTKAINSLATSDDVKVVLRWALSRSQLSSEPGVALRALANAPSGLLLGVIDGIVSLIVEDNHADEARHAIAAVGSRMSAPILLRVVDSLLAESELNLQEYSRLAEALRDLGAERPLDKVIGAMLRADNPSIRAAGQQFEESRANTS
jgi:hypothetical protein